MDKKITERIKKLLALANSDNEHEANSAMAKANKLMLENSISMDEMNRDAEYCKEQLEVQFRVPPEEEWVRPILSQFFKVDFVTRKTPGKSPNVVFILGSDTNVEIAKYVRDFLMKTYKSLFVSYRKKTGCHVSSKKSFYYGIYTGLTEKLKEAHKQVEKEHGLVLSKKDAGLEKYIRDAFDNLRSSKRKASGITDADAVISGESEGRSISINKGMNSSGQGQSLIGGK